MFNPITYKLGDKNNATHRVVILDHRNSHFSLEAIKEEYQKEEQTQLEPFANVGRSYLEKMRLVIFLEHGTFDFGEIPTNQECQEGVVGRIDSNTQGCDVNK